MALNSNSWDNSINETYIMLIPKNKSLTKVTEYHPISLCNITYKVIAKVLANKMKIVLPKIISTTQSAFVLGRLITDNIIVAFEVLHSMHCRVRRSDAYVALKLDMSKTYNKLEWCFITVVMERMGFAKRWIDLFSHCIKLVSYLILINGNPQPVFKPMRAIRQGGQLSPIFSFYVLKLLVNSSTRQKH